MTRCKECRGRADVGSEPSAAGGRCSEVSEWPRSKFPASAVRQRENFGHRNRTIGPYGCVARSACKTGRQDTWVPPYKRKYFIYSCARQIKNTDHFRRNKT